MKQKILKIFYHFFALCSRFYLWRTKALVIGITGSVGKTSCRMVVSQILQTYSHKRVYTSPKNFNSELGMTLSFFQIEEYIPTIQGLLEVTGRIFLMTLFGSKKYDVFIAEYGIDRPGDMDFLLKVAVPDIAIFTKLDFTHSGFFYDKEALGREKWKLMQSAKQRVYINSEDAFSQKYKEVLNQEVTTFFGGDIQAKDIHTKKQEKEVRLSFLYKEISLSINLLGRENAEYTCLGLAILEELGDTIEGQQQISYDFEIQPGRFTVFTDRYGNICVDSTYNAAPESMKAIIKNTKTLHKELFPDYTLAYVLGDMREIGDATEDSHKGLYDDVKDSGFVFTAGPDMYKYLTPKLKEEGYTGEVFSSLSSREVGVHLKKFLKDSKEKYMILFKGSQNTIFMEEALFPILGVKDRKDTPRQSVAWKESKDEFFGIL